VTCVLWPVPVDPEAGETETLPTRLDVVEVSYCVTGTFPAASVPIAGPPSADASTPGITLTEVWLAYYRAMRSLAEQVMILLADALGVQPALFQSKMRRSADFLRVINYPDQRAEPAAGTLRAGEHIDHGVLTILACDDAPGGLQVRARDGARADVPYCPGALVINIGDLMAYWTGHRWISAGHRVTNPPPQARGRARRQSIVFFHNPNLDATIAPLHDHSQPGNPRPRG